VMSLDLAWHCGAALSHDNGEVSPSKAGGIRFGAAQSGPLGSLTRPRFCWPPEGGLQRHMFS